MRRRSARARPGAVTPATGATGGAPVSSAGPTAVTIGGKALLRTHSKEELNPLRLGNAKTHPGSSSEVVSSGEFGPALERKQVMRNLQDLRLGTQPVPLFWVKSTIILDLLRFSGPKSRGPERDFQLWAIFWALERLRVRHRWLSLGLSRSLAAQGCGRPSSISNERAIA